ncbi:MAG TPA: hypothetical protein VGZ26_02565 [Pirellulales bacterium]|jgi:hypothetical protein|nr:hypothetical protein [Pirellulales bacterium]
MQGPRFFDGLIFVLQSRALLARLAAEIPQELGAFHQIGEFRQRTSLTAKGRWTRAGDHPRRKTSALGQQVVEKFASGLSTHGQVKSTIAAQATCGRHVVTYVRKTA